MTNEELLVLMNELKGDVKEIKTDVKELNKEFFLFKGKAFGFISLLSIAINFIAQFWHKK